MGLTFQSVGKGSADTKLEIRRRTPDDFVIALAGNPNVGKSTIFNALTGMKQHTGNWPGKTVANAQGYCRSDENGYVLVDIPGTYSLSAHSEEEEVARDFICFGQPDAVIVVCDATNLERNLNLVLQICEVAERVIVCINLMDEARKKGIEIDLHELSKRLGVPVVPTVAREKKTLQKLLETLDEQMKCTGKTGEKALWLSHHNREKTDLPEHVFSLFPEKIPRKWLSMKLLQGEDLSKPLGFDPMEKEEICLAVEAAREKAGMSAQDFQDAAAEGYVRCAERICEGVVVHHENGYGDRDRRIDQFLTGRCTGVLTMLALLMGIFWLTVSGANIVSGWLSAGLSKGQDWLSAAFMATHMPVWLHDALVLGVYRVLAWVISVMLPPMAIFFPLFTLLEDIGYLPRIAYNLDCPFKKCCACGKQALTMCMGFGCNAAGVVGCRIIDSPRERLIAMLTNSLVPCNGRFPILISMIAMFFGLAGGGILGSIWSACMLTFMILLGIGMTFLCSKLLSQTVLKGATSSFTLELPPYRRPMVGKVIIRSILDRTIFVLGRAAAVAAPTGLLIWLMANIHFGGMSLLSHCAAFLDPFGRLLGLDGVILLAFILGLPANEIVVPIAIMTYLAQSTLHDPMSTAQMKQVFMDNGWNTLTALNTMLFTLFHWPCSTTLITIRKESGSWKWTAIALILPTLIGIVLCLSTTALAQIF